MSESFEQRLLRRLSDAGPERPRSSFLLGDSSLSRSVPLPAKVLRTESRCILLFTGVVVGIAIATFVQSVGAKNRAVENKR